MRATKAKLKELTYKVLRHWERNIDRAIDGYLNHGHRDSDACAYCQFYGDIFSTNCEDGCPVWLDAGEHGCRDTPWAATKTLFPKDVWDEFMYLLNVAYSQGLEGKYMEEICS